MLERGTGDSGAAGGGDVLPPWERRAELGTMTAFSETIKQVLATPTHFFKRYDATVTSWDCLAIPCVLTTISTLTGMAVYVVAFAPLMAWVASLNPDAAAPVALGVLPLVGGACSSIVFAPVSALFSTFVTAGFIHLFLMMSGKATRSYQQTVRGYCYAQAPMILAIVPVIGHFVGGIWAIVTAIIMVREVHKTKTSIAVMSVLWLFVFCCVLYCGATGIFAFIVTAAKG